MAVKVKGKAMIINGEEYIIPPLNLAALERYADELRTLDLTVIDSSTIRMASEIIHSAMVRNYPQLSLEDVKEMIDLSNMQEAFVNVMNVSGLVPNSGEQPAPAKG